MPTDLRTFLQDVQPETTILFFGAGSSVPSHAPSVKRIIDHLSKVFLQPSQGFTLAELTDLIEQKTKDRRRLISEVRALFKNLKPTGGLLNVPLYDWKALYTTNYDELLETSYRIRGRPLLVYSSNFDFGVRGREQATRLYKVHGTISKDTSDGHAERMIVTGSDYRNLSEYRQHLYRTLQADMAESNLIIVGHSLEDPDIKELVDHAAALNAQILSGGRITLLIYTRNDDRAMLFENRGMRAVFGGIDEFFAELARKSAAHVLAASVSDDPLDKHPGLRPVTVDVAYEAEGRADVSRMFNGWPATYGDIREGLTFERGVASEVTGYTRSSGVCAVITGASGVGKTTAARQAILDLHRNYNFLSWEHKPDHTLEADDWRDIARALGAAHKQGVLFVDDAHLHIYEINNLIDALVSDKLTSLKLVIATSRNNWQPRLKTPHLFRMGKEFYISHLSNTEIGSLIYLVDNKISIRRLVEHTFAGFSPYEKRRRLSERCQADMFVCIMPIRLTPKSTRFGVVGSFAR